MHHKCYTRDPTQLYGLRQARRQGQEQNNQAISNILVYLISLCIIDRILTRGHWVKCGYILGIYTDTHTHANKNINGDVPAVWHRFTESVMHDSEMIPLLTGIGIRIRHLQKSWNGNRNQAFRVSLETELESGFQSKPGIGIGIKTVPELCISAQNDQ